jgi:hypothetical protein
MAKRGPVAYAFIIAVVLTFSMLCAASLRNSPIHGHAVSALDNHRAGSFPRLPLYYRIKVHRLRQLQVKGRRTAAMNRTCADCWRAGE